MDPRHLYEVAASIWVSSLELGCIYNGSCEVMSPPLVGCVEYCGMKMYPSPTRDSPYGLNSTQKSSHNVADDVHEPGFIFHCLLLTVSGRVDLLCSSPPCPNTGHALNLLSP